MDVTQLVTSLVTTIDLSVKVQSLCIQYLRAVKYGDWSMKRLREELEVLEITLDSAHRLLKNPNPLRPHVALLLHDALTNCFERLHRLESEMVQIQGFGIVRKAMRSFKMQFHGSSIEIDIDILQAYRNEISKCLKMSQWTTLQSRRDEWWATAEPLIRDLISQTSSNLKIGARPMVSVRRRSDKEVDITGMASGPCVVEITASSPDYAKQLRKALLRKGEFGAAHHGEYIEVGYKDGSKREAINPWRRSQDKTKQEKIVLQVRTWKRYWDLIDYTLPMRFVEVKVETVIHGTESPNGNAATLIVMSFRPSVTQDERTGDLRIIIWFEDIRDGSYEHNPEVLKLWPDSDYSLNEATLAGTEERIPPNRRWYRTAKNEAEIHVRRNESQESGIEFFCLAILLRVHDKIDDFFCGIYASLDSSYGGVERQEGLIFSRKRLEERVSTQNIQKDNLRHVDMHQLVDTISMTQI